MKGFSKIKCQTRLEFRSFVRQFQDVGPTVSPDTRYRSSRPFGADEVAQRPRGQPALFSNGYPPTERRRRDSRGFSFRSWRYVTVILSRGRAQTGGQTRRQHQARLVHVPDGRGYGTLRVRCERRVGREKRLTRPDARETSGPETGKRTVSQARDGDDFTIAVAHRFGPPAVDVVYLFPLPPRTLSV